MKSIADEGQLMAIERILDGDLRGRVRDLLATEDILFEAARDLLKDRIKGVIQAKIEEDPDLKSELEDTIRYYYTTRIRTVYAELKAARAATRLGIRLLPDDLQEDVSHALIELFEREIGTLLERAL